MKIAVFCSSTFGANPKYKNEAINLINILSQNNHELVYGGSKSGLMGLIADKMLENGGIVTGVITKNLAKNELAHTKLNKLYTVNNIQERKSMMYDLADAFIIMPGGCGTMEEFFEVYSWAQLGYHQKPIAFLNVNGYYNKLFEFLRQMEFEEFLYKRFVDMLIISENPNDILHSFKSYVNPKPKWA